MSSVTFDTLEFLNTLKFSGIGDKQAEAITQAVKTSHNNSNIATKNDLEKLEISIRGELTLIKWMLGFILAGIATII